MTKKKKPGEAKSNRWTTPEQRQFLEPFRTTYLEAKAAKNTGQFWPQLYNAFQDEYPIKPTEAELALCDGDERRAFQHPDVQARKKKRDGVSRSLDSLDCAHFSFILAWDCRLLASEYIDSSSALNKKN